MNGTEMKKLGEQARPLSSSEVAALLDELEEANKTVDYWRSRCLKAETRIDFAGTGCDTTEVERLRLDNNRLAAERDTLRRRLDLRDAQLDIIYRIFPAPEDAYA